MSRRQLSHALLAALLGGAVTAAALTAVGEGRRAAGPPAQLASTVPGGAAPVEELFAHAAPAVVAVRARSVQPGEPFGVSGNPSQGISSGSGFVLDEEGRILTSARVVSGATSVQVTFADLRTVPARVVGKDEATDLAVLQVEPEGLDLRPLELGDSDTVRAGDPALAIGNPSGLEPTAGTGRVSRAPAQVVSGGGTALEDVIRTDAVILPAGAGGPVLGADGRVIGISSPVAGGDAGTGSAVPVNTAKDVLAALEERHKVIRPYLGVRARAAEPGPGVIVDGVDPGSPAAAAGLRVGDVVEAVDGAAVDGLEAFLRHVEERAPGDAVVLRVLRDGARMEVPVGVGERPATLPAG